MKKLMTILCLLCFAGCAYAEMYEIPGSRVETTEEVKVEQQDNTRQVSDTEVKRKRIWRHKDNNPTNTYWNFGKVPFWTGSI